MSSAQSKSAKLAYHFGSVTTNSVTTDSLHLLGKGSVTQATSITTSVTLPYPVGHIRTVSATISTLGNQSFTASHLSIDSNSIIFASIGGYSGNGRPEVRVTSQTQGSCVFRIDNTHTIDALSAPVTIAYQIL